MVADLLGGHVAVGVNPVADVADHHSAGKLKVLAVGGAQRSPLLPQVPTLAELGHKNRGRRRRAVWLFPAQRTPATIVAAYTQALKTILEMPQVKAQFAPRSCQTHVQPPEEFAAAIRRESEIWRGVVAATGSTPQG
ncbi:MAG: Twin-arginine translocation pathway signal [Ramlibacter sp.]|nr:Twin-arginine translocation pathway signal [Ramlibacter sp.]